MWRLIRAQCFSSERVAADRMHHFTAHTCMRAYRLHDTDHSLEPFKAAYRQSSCSNPNRANREVQENVGSWWTSLQVVRPANVQPSRHALCHPTRSESGLHGREYCIFSYLPLGGKKDPWATATVQADSRPVGKICPKSRKLQGSSAIKWRLPWTVTWTDHDHHLNAT